jgi:hypothetical protein
VFVTTFYSYKGGVGRTLALANVAILLAARGKKVLVVDFDLEAPGLTTLDPFISANDRLGVVDLVTKYIDTRLVPPLDPYIHRCVSTPAVEGDWGKEIAIDVLPAGTDDDDGYASRLSHIDWNLLYDDLNGFLFMEELRASWESRGYDYVLIDSRTGHTDVGGICTRQLPDAVAAVFFPNEQNLIGLRQVVRGVRQGGGRPQPIELLFVASRVPRLDDEHGHLRRRLGDFQQELGYTDDRLVKIEHYDSMMLLNQSIFVLDRPTSGLASQYRELAAQLAQFNDDDADGAFYYANGIASGRSTTKLSVDGARERPPESRLARIGMLHSGDCIIQYALARAYYRLRNLSAGAEAADAAVAVMGSTNTSREIRPTLPSSTHRLRLKILLELDRAQEAMTSAHAVLADPHSTETMVIDAMLAYASVDASALAEARSLPAIANASPEALLSVARQLAQSPAGVIAAAELIEMALATIDADADGGFDLHTAQVILIAAGCFARAAELDVRAADPGDEVVNAFNAAMAQWGRDGAPDESAFLRVADLLETMPAGMDGPNRRQCLALANAVLGRTTAMMNAIEQARAMMNAMQRRDFSCWRYFSVSPVEFEEDLEAIARFGTGGGEPPAVITGKARGV